MTLRQILNENVAGEKFYLTTQEVRELLGVDAVTFQQWLARGLISFKVITAGRRTWRRFDVGQIPRLILVSEFLSSGLPIGEAIDTADIALRWRWKPSAAPWAVLLFRQKNLIYFAEENDRHRLPSIFRQYDRASCIFMFVGELQQRVAKAVQIAKGQWTGGEELRNR